jgi:hypothetical protein
MLAPWRALQSRQSAAENAPTANHERSFARRIPKYGCDRGCLPSGATGPEDDLTPTLKARAARATGKMKSDLKLFDEFAALLAARGFPDNEMR